MNKRDAGEAKYARKFDEFGLSETFKFIGRDWSSYHGGKVLIECRRCGHDFSTWSFKEILKGNQSHLICPGCGATSDGGCVWVRSPECDAAMAFYQEGHSVSETAARFGRTKIEINNAVNSRGVTNGRDFRQAWQECNDRRREQSRVKREAEKSEREKRKAEELAKRRALAAETQRMKEIEKAAQKQARINLKQQAEDEKKSALFRLINDKCHVCSVCGKQFSIAEFMGSKGLKLIPTDPKYCSRECERKHNNRLSKEWKRGKRISDTHRRRARRYGCEYDASVTLDALIARDGLRCNICGKMCNPEDREWSEYAGPLSPSIDHIIPMSKGGGHTWGNVQVAHIICNSYKGAEMVE